MVTCRRSVLKAVSDYLVFTSRRGAMAKGAALSWNDSVTPFSLCGKERGGWEGGLMTVKTSSPPVISHFRNRKGIGEQLHLMLGASFSGNLGNYLRSLKALLLKAICMEV